MEEPVKKASKDGNIRKLTLPDGLQVGIMNLGDILDEVFGLDLMDPEGIKAELLARVKACNFVASGAEKEYAAALLEEYRHKYDKSSQTKPKKHKKPHDG
ncbi:hypothetical protein ACFLXY_06780 [Chloroflexota bacterium]